MARLAASRPVGEAGAPRYRFGSLEHRGVLAGWRGGQLVAVAAGLLGAVAIVRAAPSIAGAAAALAVALASGAVATWPLQGRTAEEWAPDAVHHLAGRTAHAASRMARPFAGLEVLAVECVGPTADRPLGLHGATAEGASTAVVVDRRRRVYCAVLRASAPGFVLSGGRDKGSQVAGWGSVLASLAHDAGTVHRVQWVERTIPASHEQLRTTFEEHRVLAGSSSPAASYGQLLEDMPAASGHETVLVVAVRSGRGARWATTSTGGRAARGGSGGDGAACRTLLFEVERLRHRLAEVGVDALAPLGPVGLERFVRGVFDPVDREVPAAAGAGMSTEDVPRRARRRWPWPMGLDEGWGFARADGTVHATYWVAEWPRSEVGPDFLGPLLLLDDVRRSMSVVMEPVAPLQAARQVEADRTADLADAELRRRGGFLSTARRRREAEGLARREVELADGHSQYRFCGYVTVSANDVERLERDCLAVEQAAARAGLEIRRCYGDQARAFTCVLPLARGLGSRR